MAAGIQELEKKLSKEKILPRRIEFHVARFPDEYATLKERYIAVNRQTETTSTTKSSFSLKEDGDQTLTRTKREERENLQISIVIDLMAWKSIQKIGAGLRNFGATCYMNSSLQVSSLRLSSLFIFFLFLFLFLFSFTFLLSFF